MAAWALCSLPTSKTAIFSTSTLNTTMIVIFVFESSLSSHRPLFLGSHRLVKLDGRRVDACPASLHYHLHYQYQYFHTQKGGWLPHYTIISVQYPRRRVDGAIDQTRMARLMKLESDQADTMMWLFDTSTWLHRAL